MGAGIPGTGMATLFYIVSALLMPCRELIITAQGRSSRRRWRLVIRQFLIALAICAIGFGTYRLLSESVVVPNVQSVPIPALLITVLMFFGYLLLANAVAFVIPRRVTLPPAKVLGRSSDSRMGPALE